MPELSELEVDLTKSPAPENVLPIAAEKNSLKRCVSIPDLHGNALLAIYHLLISHHFEDKKIENHSVYCKLSALYQTLDHLTNLLKKNLAQFPSPNNLKDRLQQWLCHQLGLSEKEMHAKKIKAGLLKDIKENIASFKTYLKQLSRTAQIVTIRFLGDIFADRGANDFLMFCVLNLCYENNIPYEIILGNHDVNLLLAYFYHALNLNKPSPTTLPDEFINSLQNMRLWIQQGLVSEDEIKEFIQKIYFPRIKLFSYDRYQNNGNEKLIIYSHAPIDFEIIKNTCDSLQVTYKDNTMSEFCETIDTLNATVIKKIMAGEIKQYFEREEKTRWIIYASINQMRLTMEAHKNALKPVLCEALTIYLAASATEHIPDGKKTVDKIISDFFTQPQLADEVFTKYLTDFEKLNDIFLNPLIPTLKKLYYSYKEAENCYEKSGAGIAMHYQETPLHTALWSRIDRVVAKKELQKHFAFRLADGKMAHTSTDYYWPNSGWKAHASNTHGHASDQHAMKEIVSTTGQEKESSRYCNTDRSNLGKSSTYVRGKLFQFYSTSKIPKSLAPTR